MLTDNLFDAVLLNPAKSGANQLYIVSGYATPAIVYKHLQAVRDELRTKVEIRLIVGMTSLDGLAKAYHQQFQKLVAQDSKRQFECWYMTKLPPVHAKTYAWYQDGLPSQAFTGSANYSHNGFFKQREAIASDDPTKTYAYFQSLLDGAISCLDSKVEQAVKLTDVQIRRARQVARKEPVTTLPRRLSPEALATQPVRMSLLDNNGNLPARSGLNWGQRPEYHRNPNQAYIRIPASIRHSGFFPPRKQHFTLITDDGKTLDAVIAQDNDKAIETTFDNSLLGSYFRQRLGLPSGAPVTLADLKRYGRTDINFIKIDDETYFMDFSVRRGQSNSGAT
jgi:hypothetical protein